MKIFLILLPGLLSPLLSCAQNESILTGRITDETWEEGMVGAPIKIWKANGTPAIAVTDLRGCYHIQLDSGIYTVEIICEGYTTTWIVKVPVRTGQTTVCNASLQDRYISQREIDLFNRRYESLATKRKKRRLRHWLDSL